MAEGSHGLPEEKVSKVGEFIDLLAPLQLTQEGVAAHLWRLVDSTDEVLRVGAVCALFDAGGISKRNIERIMPLAVHMSVSGRLFNYLVSRYEYSSARELAVNAQEPPTTPVRRRFEAFLDEDWQMLVAAEEQAFLNDGQIEHLGRASDYAERAAGWQEAALWSLRAVLLTPVAPQPTGKLLTILDFANRFAELRRLLDIYKKANLHRDMCLLLEARLCLEDKQYDRLTKIIPSIALEKLDERLRPKAFAIMARACEAQGRYEEAIKWFEKQNDSGRAPPLGKQGRYFNTLTKLEQIEVGNLSHDPNVNYFSMVGFPRSGTTLLENALAAHPVIETFEEIPSDTVMFKAMGNVPNPGIAGAEERRRAFEAARECYYGEIRRRSRKPSAVVYIDKLPMRTAYIRVLEKIFPQRKYIFSIRHPYDVVLSCFQQRFKLNQAMENFRRFDDACTLYDQVMQRWFDVFPGPTERVQYVKYDDLVLNFDEELRKVLAFLGVEWDDAVRNFAAAAERRKVSTPSYSKVRAGLDLGIQSQWRDYSFLFQKSAAGPLKPWAERFGYETV
jgi:tetratricopeptide (TPR) repeat protein